MHRQQLEREPDYAAACEWWADLPDIWTPIGWKDHLFRFNVLWNGTILAWPDLNRRTQEWKGQGVQLTLFPSLSSAKPGGWWELPTFMQRDDGMVRQGWNDGPAPVLWSEWVSDGRLLREEIFGHVPNGKDVGTGIEPLFAWVRLSVQDACAALPLEKHCGFFLKINAPHFNRTMHIRGHWFDPVISRYPRPLTANPSAYSFKRGLRLLEPNGKVRLGLAPGQTCETSFEPHQIASTKPDPYFSDASAWLHIKMPAHVGRHVDLLIPMLPTDRKIFDRELALGYRGALAEASRYWRRKPATAARVSTPETGVNSTMAHSLKLAEIIAEKNPADGQYTLLTGSLSYADLWATPHSMACIMLLDTLGYHSVLERYLEIFRKEQGTIVAPGDCFKLHSGYLSSPKSLTSIDWISDHGALLYTIAEHALLSGNRAFIARWEEAILKACEFIQYARRLDAHDGVMGVLPPAVATDCGTKIQAAWSNGWVYKGLVTAARLLCRIGHPRAAEFGAEAEDFRAVFQEAYREKASRMPTWKDSRGRRHRFAPVSLSGDQPWETRHAFYLDGGPLFLVYAGLMEADDPLMKSTLLWFREGQPTTFLRHDSNAFQLPCLDHEMSSCEPCYSWNVFHSWQRGDRARFLEGMYSLFAGSVSRKTFVSCETRGGITGTLFSATLAICLARLAVVDDQIEEGALHLLRLVPRAWLRPDVETVFEKMPTEFGPVNLRFRLSEDERTMRVTYAAEFRVVPRRVLLHIPPLQDLKTVVVNGRKMGLARQPVPLPA